MKQRLPKRWPLFVFARMGNKKLLGKDAICTDLIDNLEKTGSIIVSKKKYL